MPILTTLGAACARAWGFTSGLLKDPYFNLTTLLLPGNGTNGAQNNTFLDSSTNNFTITRNGNTTQGTFSPFSQTGWGNYFNGSSRLSVSSNVALTPGSGDFTIECWIYPTAAFSTFNGIFVGDTNGAMNFGKISGGIGLRISGVSDVISATAPSINQWTHIAITRSGTDVRLFYNGIQQGSTVTNSTNFAQSTVYLGDNGAGTAYWNGYLSNLRFVKSTALYTSNFTPSTTPLTAISNTQFLTFQSNRFVDNSSNAFVITTSGSPSVTPFSPFAPTAAYTTAAVGGSGYFDGTGDYLTVPDSTNWVIDTDYTIEFWFYASSFPGQYNNIIAQRNSGGTAYWGLNYDTSLGWALFWNNGAGETKITRNQNSPLNNWVHVAVTRSSGTGYMFLNGSQAGATFSFGAISDIVSSLFIGAWPTGGDLINGYISSLRLIKGTALYTSNFTPPTAPPTAITNTSLLLNFTNAGITDATAKNDLETVGNTQISTSVSKFGGGSMSFDGTGDELYFPSSVNFDLGTTYTIECWVYPNSVASNFGLILRGLYDSGTSNWTGLQFSLRWLVGTGLRAYFFGTTVSNEQTITSSSTALAANQWQHVAMVRDGTNGALYIDGVRVGTISSLNTPAASTQPIRIANWKFSSGDNYYNGYIDDFRISRYARYSGASFTPPTAPFPVQ